MSFTVGEILRGLNNSQLEMILTNSSHMLLFSIEGKLLFASESFSELIGVSQAKLTKQNDAVFSAVDLEKIKKNKPNLLKGKTCLDSFSVVSKNGTKQRFNAIIEPIKKDGKAITEYLVLLTSRDSYQDINEFLECDTAFIELFNNSPIPKSLTSVSDKKYIYVNKAWEKFIGYSREEVIGKTALDLNLLSLEDAILIGEKLSDKQSLDSFEYHMISKTGEKKKVLLSLVKLQIAGEFYINSSVIDINELDKSEKKLLKEKKFTEELMASLQEGLIIVNLEGKILMVNDSTCKILGYSKEELIGLDLPYPFARLEDFAEIEKKNKSISKGDIPPFQFEFIRKNGEHFTASFATGNIKNDKGEAIALFGTMKDISQDIKLKKTLEDKAKKSTERKEAILKLASLVGDDLDKVFKEITSMSAKILNVARVSVWSLNEDHTEIHCQNVYSLKDNTHGNHLRLKAKDYPNYFKALKKYKTIRANDARKDKVTKEFTESYLDPLGITSMMDVFVQGAKGTYGIICFEHIGSKKIWSAEDEEFASSIANIVSLCVESQERKEAENKLKLENEFSSMLINTMHDGMAVIDLDAKIIQVNPAFCNMLGYTEKELVGMQRPFPFSPPEIRDLVDLRYDKLKAGTLNGKFESVYVHKKGHRFPISVEISSIKDNQGKKIGYFSTVMDITDRVKADKMLKDNAAIALQRKRTIMRLVGLVGEDFEAALKEIVTVSAKALNVGRVTVWQYQNDNSELLSKLYYNAKEDHYDENGLVITKGDYPEYFKAFENKSLINIKDVVKDSVTKAFAEEYFVPYNITSRLDLVIYGRESNYGIISFENSGDKRVFTPEEENFAASIVNVVSLMIESTERKLAENKLIEANDKLLKVNTELNKLKKELEQENVYLREEIGLVFNYEEMVYGSVAFSKVLTEVERVAVTDATVLLLGESGTGKELLARAIHNISPRKNKPLIKVNCAAIPKELIESELFGHKKGAFTGAINDKLGKFQLADGGTLFLDEIGEMPIEMQPKLLRAIQESEVEQVGGVETQKVDIRIITATNKDLKAEISNKNFREDLYFRINVFPIHVPPLRERVEDIPILIEHFVNKFSKEYSKSIKYIPETTKRNMQTYAWPGNIRELENLIERAVILSNNEMLSIPTFESSPESSEEKLISSTVFTLDEAQRAHIIKILKKTNWKIDGEDGASKLLDIKPSTLRDRMKKLGIKRPE